MHILFLYNSFGGKGLSKRQIGYIKKNLEELDPLFEFVTTASVMDFKERTLASCGTFDYLLISGGDGSINLAINQLAERRNAPILGFFPTGTCNDAAKNYGINKNIKRCMEIVKQGYFEQFDILKCNSHYSVFAMALGGLSNIPYLTSRKGKKHLGSLAYYALGITQMFRTSKIHGIAQFSNGDKINFCTPFLIILNTSHVGGYNVNPHSNVQDGKFDVYIPKQRPQVLAMIPFLFHSKKIPHYLVDEIVLKTDCEDAWDIDGERGEKGSMHIKMVPKGIRVLCYKNRRKKK